MVVDESSMEACSFSGDSGSWLACLHFWGSDLHRFDRLLGKFGFPLLTSAVDEFDHLEAKVS